MRVGMIDTQGIRRRWECVGSKLDERGRRVFAAGEVRAAGRGGLAAVSAITGLARSTIGRGLKDLDAAPLPKGRERRKGGGRRHLSSRDATLIADLRSVIEPATLGDPMRPLLWVSKSHDKVADALRKQGHEISASSVKRLLPTLGYSRQSNRKADEGSKHPDRNAQFEHINAKAIAAQAAGRQGPQCLGRGLKNMLTSQRDRAGFVPTSTVQDQLNATGGNFEFQCYVVTQSHS
jgi:hypothetical protein